MCERLQNRTIVDVLKRRNLLRLVLDDGMIVEVTAPDELFMSFEPRFAIGAQYWFEGQCFTWDGKKMVLEVEVKNHAEWRPVQ
jgi:hypothetical protein